MLTDLHLLRSVSCTSLRLLDHSFLSRHFVRIALQAHQCQESDRSVHFPLQGIGDEPVRQLFPTPPATLKRLVELKCAMLISWLAGAKNNYVVFSSVAALSAFGSIGVTCASLAFATLLSIIYSFYYPLRHTLRDCPCNVGLTFQPWESYKQKATRNFLDWPVSIGSQSIHRSCRIENSKFTMLELVVEGSEQHWRHARKRNGRRARQKGGRDSSKWWPGFIQERTIVRLHVFCFIGYPEPWVHIDFGLYGPFRPYFPSSALIDKL